MLRVHPGWMGHLSCSYSETDSRWWLVQLCDCKYSNRLSALAARCVSHWLVYSRRRACWGVPCAAHQSGTNTLQQMACPTSDEVASSLLLFNRRCIRSNAADSNAADLQLLPTRDQQLARHTHWLVHPEHVATDLPLKPWRSF